MEKKELMVPRGNPGQLPLALDMTEVYLAERRLREVSVVNPQKAPELMGFFNDVCNTTTKYIAWIEYEILVAQKQFDLAKATVILEKSPEIYRPLKDTGIKYNEDFRDACVARDPECGKASEKVQFLVATRALLDAKARSFVRAYNAAKAVWERRNTVAASPNIGSVLGGTPTPTEDVDRP